MQWGALTTKSISFSSGSLTSATFTFISPQRLLQLDAYNGGTGSTVVTRTCAGQASISATLGSGAVQTIVTNWTAASTTVMVANTSDWNTNFDNLVIDSGPPAGTPTSTPTATPTSTLQPTATSTPSASTVTPTPGPSACPCSIWPTITVPTITTPNDANAVEVGVQFQSDTSGFITALRFYKGAGNTGRRTGNMWTSTGTQLATTTFPGETATGWQPVTFTSPLAITANTTYVASYYAPNGHYAGDVN